MSKSRVMVMVFFVGVVGLMWGGGSLQGLAWTVGHPVPWDQSGKRIVAPMFVDDSMENDEYKDMRDHDETGSMSKGHHDDDDYDEDKGEIKGKKKHDKKRKVKGEGKHKRNGKGKNHKGKKKRKHKGKGKNQEHEGDVSEASKYRDHRIAELRKQQQAERGELRQKHRAEAKGLLDELRSERGGHGKMPDERRKDSQERQWKGKKHKQKAMNRKRGYQNNRAESHQEMASTETAQTH